MHLDKPLTNERADEAAVSQEPTSRLSLVDVVADRGRDSAPQQRSEDSRSARAEGASPVVARPENSQAEAKNKAVAAGLPQIDLTNDAKAHTVKKNESLWKIAADTLKDQTKKATDIESYVKQIVEANKDKHPGLAKRPDKIDIGMELKLPDFNQKPGEKPSKKSEPNNDNQVKPEAPKLAPQAEKNEPNAASKTKPEAQENQAPQSEPEKVAPKLAPASDAQSNAVTQEKPAAQAKKVEDSAVETQTQQKVVPQVENSQRDADTQTDSKVVAKQTEQVAPNQDAARANSDEKAKLVPQAENKQEPKLELVVKPEDLRNPVQQAPSSEPKPDAQPKVDEKKPVVEGNQLVIPNIESLIPGRKELLPPGNPWAQDKKPNPAAEVYLPKVQPAEQKTEGAQTAQPPKADQSGEFRIANGVKYKPIDGPKDNGKASFYGGYFHGRKTANGERYDQMGMTVAHKSLPFGTMLEVTNPKNGESVILRVTDRGPFVKGRVLDLSVAAAQKLGMVDAGVINVDYKIIGMGPRRIGPVVPDNPRPRRRKR